MATWRSGHPSALLDRAANEQRGPPSSKPLSALGNRELSTAVDWPRRSEPDLHRFTQEVRGTLDSTICLERATLARPSRSPGTSADVAGAGRRR